MGVHGSLIRPIEQLWEEYDHLLDTRGASELAIGSDQEKSEVSQGGAHQLLGQTTVAPHEVGRAADASGSTKSTAKPTASSSAQAGPSTNKAPSGVSPSSGGKPGDPPSSRPPPSGSGGGALPANVPAVIFVGIPKGSDHELVEIEVAKLTDDQFFSRLRGEFHRIRTAFLNCFSVCTFSHCEFTEVCTIHSA